MKFRGYSKKGFTAIELLIVLFILGLISTIVVGTFSAYKTYHVLDKSVAKVIGVIEEARGLTLSAKNDTHYGVHFGQTEIVLFEGSTYSAGEASNKSMSMDSGVEILLVDLDGNGNEIVFDRLTGTTEHSGNIVIALTSSTTQTATITVHKTGLIEEQN